MTATATDRLAAELAGIRERAAQITSVCDIAECTAGLGGPCSGHDAERLAEVTETVLRLAAGWDGKAAEIMAATQTSPPGETRMVLLSGRASTMGDLAEQLRETIAAVLLGEDGT